MSALPDYPREWDELDAPKRIGPEDRPSVALRHLGGESRVVEVESASEDGVLHVRWPGGAGAYAVHVFGRGSKTHAPPGLYATARSMRQIGWALADPEAARALWRAMTGLAGKTRWVRKFNRETKRYEVTRVTEEEKIE